MFRNLSPGAVGITARFEECLEVARSCGFAGIDLPVADPEFVGEPDTFAAGVRRAGLRWGSFGLPLDFRESEGAFRNGLDILKVHAHAARRVGCNRCVTWIMPGHDELDYDANFDRHATRLSRVAAALAHEGVRFGIEFVGCKTLRDRFRHEFVHDADGILALADAIGSGAGVLLDSFHWYTSGGRKADITEKLRGRIVAVHVNDARPGRKPEEQIDNERALPGETGVIDLAAFLGALKESGYDGPVSAEPFLHELAELPAEEVGKRVAASMAKVGI